MAKIEVRPLDRKQWHGKKGKENFSRPKAIEALYDDETGMYATGLTPEEEIKYSKRLGGVDLSKAFNPSEPHPYFSTKAATIVLPNHTVIFDTDKPSDYVKIKVMKASKFVANSQAEYDNGKWPFATHIIYDGNEEIITKASKIQLKNKASAILFKMDKSAKIAIIQVLRNKNAKGRSDEFIDVEIDDIITNEPGDFLKWAEMGREEVTLRASVLELLQKNLLTKDPTGIHYLGDTLGYDIDAVIDFFKKPENQHMKVAIFEKLNS